MTWAHRSPNLSFVSFVFTVFGCLLLMVADRPDLRARPDQPAPVVEALEGVGGGLTSVGGAILATSALRYSRGLARAKAQSLTVSASEAVGPRPGP